MSAKDACPHWLDAISAYLDGELPPGEEQAVHAHLRQCHACTEALVDLVPVVQALRSLPPTRPMRDLWPAIASELAVAPGVFSQAWPVRALARIRLIGPARGLAAAALVAMAGGSIAVAGYQHTLGQPVANLDTYWHQHELMAHDQGLPGLYAPELSAVEASYRLDE